MAAFELWIEQKVLLAVVKGSWNEMTARDYAEAFKTQVQPLIHSDWAHIVYLNDWALGSPDIEPIVRDLVEWCLLHNLRRAAHIYSPNMVKKYQLDRMIISGSGQFEKRVYTNETAAFAWLVAQGYPTHTQHFAQITA